MRDDRKGIGGMMETMVALMIVITTLTVFMGMLSYLPSEDTGIDEKNFEFVEKLEIKEGKIVGDIHEDLIYLIESNNYSMIEIKVSVIGDVSNVTFVDSFGIEKTDNVDIRNGTFNIGSDDGRILLANYEVIIWS